MEDVLYPDCLVSIFDLIKQEKLSTSIPLDVLDNFYKLNCFLYIFD